MALFTPPDISGGLKDFWDYMRADRPHRWPALGLAITIPGLIFYFIADAVAPPPPQRTLIYVQSWGADRSEFDVRRDWLNRALEANDRNQRRRDGFGAIGNAVGQTSYDKNAANREFDAARATIRQALADLEAAQAAGRPLPPLPRAGETRASPLPRAGQTRTPPLPRAAGTETPTEQTRR